MRTARRSTQRPVCKEATIRASNSSIAILCAGALCLGCAAPKKQESKKPKEKPLLGSKLTINTSAGEATRRDTGTERLPLYHIKWNQAKIDVADEGIFAGSLEGVSGEMYKDGSAANTFQADSARAEKDTFLTRPYVKFLTLTGHVRIDAHVTVDAKERQTTLTCDRLEWYAKEKLMKAFGHVEVSGTLGQLSGLNEVWASPELKTIATPNMFKAQ